MPFMAEIKEGKILYSKKNMAKWKKLLLFALSGCLSTACFFTGCGKGQGTDGSTSTGQTGQEGESGSTSGDGSSTGTSEDDANVPDFQTPGEGTSEQEPEPTPTEEPKLYVQKSRFKAGEEIYSDNVRFITALGLKEYDQIKSKEYTDKPAKGKKYLVLFLDVWNRDEEQLYFHPDYLSAKVDGKPVEHTFLYHDPEDYTTIFKNIGAGDHEEGFIVWEVPTDWKKMVVTFKEFELLGGKRLKLTMTPGDLKDPEAPSK